MEEGEIRQFAECQALIAEMEAIKIEIAGMQAENEYRLQVGNTVAYSGAAFDNCAVRMREIAKRLRTEI